MSTNKTPNYQLNQWVKSDQVLMDEFNQDNAKIDAALDSLSGQVDTKADQSALNTLNSRVSSLTTTVNGKASQSSVNALKTVVDKLGNCTTYHTTYTGKGTTTTTITFPRKPLAVFVVDRNAAWQTVTGFQGMTRIKMATTLKAELIDASWSGNSLTYTTESYIMSLAGRIYDVFAILDTE